MIKKILKFFNKNINNDVIEKLTHHLRFKNMNISEIVNYNYVFGLNIHTQMLFLVDFKADFLNQKQESISAVINSIFDQWIKENS